MSPELQVIISVFVPIISVVVGISAFRANISKMQTEQRDKDLAAARESASHEKEQDMNIVKMQKEIALLFEKNDKVVVAVSALDKGQESTRQDIHYIKESLSRIEKAIVH